MEEYKWNVFLLQQGDFVYTGKTFDRYPEAMGAVKDLLQVNALQGEQTYLIMPGFVFQSKNFPVDINRRLPAG